jgi:molecular chaperone DnaK
MGIIYGIDLGTTYSAAAFVNPQGEPVCLHLGEEGKWTIPSSVLFVNAKEAYVGEDAIENSYFKGSLLAEFAKRDLGLQNGRTWKYGGWEYQPEEISALVLRKIAQQINKSRGLPKANEVVISHPQYFYLNQKEATKEAGELAGLKVVATVTEPQAAAIAYGMWERAENEQRDLTVLVFDLGGGTFDATLMKVAPQRFQMIGSDGEARLGGLEWDQEIVRLAKEEFRQRAGGDFDDAASEQEEVVLRKAAQRAKEELSKPSKDRHRFFVEAAHDKLPFVITRADFEAKCKYLVTRCLDCCARLFQQTGYNWSKVDEVLMVGSSTKMPMIQEAVRRASGKELIMDAHPKLMVAKGAAIWGHWVQAGKVDPRWGDSDVKTGLETHESPVTGCTAHGLGVLAQKGGATVVDTLIPQNTPTPHAQGQTFYTMTRNATSVEVPIYEGESADPEACHQIGRAIIDKLPPLPKGTPVEVTFRIDISGRLQVEVMVATGAEQSQAQKERRIITVDRNVIAGTSQGKDFETRRRHLAEIAIH